MTEICKHCKHWEFGEGDKEIYKEYWGTCDVGKEDWPSTLLPETVWNSTCDKWESQ